MQKTDILARAKVNLTLHVTGQRDDGYHLLQSLVVFADVGDRLHLTRSDRLSLRVTGPMAQGVPEGSRNLVWQVAERCGGAVAITLEKHLPAAAGIGGGSSDAAATWRALGTLFGTLPDVDLGAFGADVPVCALQQAALMTGIGDDVRPVPFEPLNAVLVNPRVAVSTPDVFRALTHKANPPMGPIPDSGWDRSIAWLAQQRNDLQAPAIGLQPVIADVLAALGDAGLARMSGSGATCFGLYPDHADAQAAADRIARDHPQWWVAPTRLR